MLNFTRQLKSRSPYSCLAGIGGVTVESHPSFSSFPLQVAPVVKERMMKKGSMMIGYQAHGDKPNFFRMVVISPQVSREDLNFVLDEIHNLGQDL